MKHLFIVIFILGCARSHDRSDKLDNTVGSIDVLINECHDQQCYQVLRINDLDCVAQYRGGIWCRERN